MNNVPLNCNDNILVIPKIKTEIHAIIAKNKNSVKAFQKYYDYSKEIKPNFESFLGKKDITEYEKYINAAYNEKSAEMQHEFYNFHDDTVYKFNYKEATVFQLFLSLEMQNGDNFMDKKMTSLYKSLKQKIVNALINDNEIPFELLQLLNTLLSSEKEISAYYYLGGLTENDSDVDGSIAKAIANVVIKIYEHQLYKSFRHIENEVNPTKKNVPLAALEKEIGLKLIEGYLRKFLDSLASDDGDISFIMQELNIMVQLGLSMEVLDDAYNMFATHLKPLIWEKETELLEYFAKRYHFTNVNMIKLIICKYIQILGSENNIQYTKSFFNVFLKTPFDINTHFDLMKKIRINLDLLYIYLGKTVITPLIKKNILLISQQPLKSKRNLTTTVYFEELLLSTNIATCMPSFVPSLNITKKEVYPFNDVTYFAHQKVKSSVKNNNPALFGIKHNRKLFDDYFSNNPFKLNDHVVLEFLQLFTETINSTPKTILNSFTHMMMLNFVYKINITKIIENIPQSILKYAPDFPETIINYLIDFNTIEKYDFLIENNNAPDIDNYKTFFRQISNKFYSYKIYINSLLFEIAVCNCYKFFYYSWFSDARGRIYYLEGLLNPQRQSNFRSFLTFYTDPKVMLNEKVVEKKFKFGTIMEYKTHTENLLLAQIDSLTKKFPGFINIYKPEEKTKIKDIIQHLTDVKFTDIFTLLAFIQDYRDFYNSNKIINLNSYYGLDFSASGLINIALLLHSETLAIKCNLYHIEEKDPYTSCANFTENKLKEYFLIYDNFVTPTLDIIFFKTLSLEKLKVCREAGDKNKIKINLPGYKPRVQFKSLPDKERNNFYATFIENHINATDTVDNDYNKLLAELKKDFFNLFDNKENFFNDFKIVGQFMYFIKNLKKNESIHQYIITRKSKKSLVMTKPYGSTTKGRQTQQEVGFIRESLKIGNWFSDKTLQAMRFVSGISDRIFNLWSKQNIPQAMILYKALAETTKKNKWDNNLTFSTEQFTFQNKPFIEKSIKLYHKITNKPKDHKPKHIRIRSYTKIVDTRKLINSLPANIIQSIEAYLLNDFISAIKIIENKYNIIIGSFTIHDCFAINPLYACILRKVLYDCLLKLLKDDLLNVIFNFKDHPGMYKSLRSHGYTSNKEMKEEKFLRKKIHGQLKEIYSKESHQIPKLFNYISVQFKKLKINKQLLSEILYGYEDSNTKRSDKRQILILVDIITAQELDLVTSISKLKTEIENFDEYYNIGIQSCTDKIYNRLLPDLISDKRFVKH